jgi:putative Mg2+ transporter-C (MgtC) family protein
LKTIRQYVSLQKIFELAKSQIKGEGPSAIISLTVDDRKLRPVMLDTLRAMEYIRYAEEL